MSSKHENYDYRHLPNSASNVIFCFALDRGSEVEIGLFSL